MLEILATLAASWIGWRHVADSMGRLAAPRLVPLGASRYRRALRRLAQHRYTHSCLVRQQVRVLEHLSWQMRGRIGSPPGPVFTMTTVNVLPFIYLNQEMPTGYVPDPKYRGIAGLLRQQKAVS